MCTTISSPRSRHTFTHFVAIHFTFPSLLHDQSTPSVSAFPLAIIPAIDAHSYQATCHHRRPPPLPSQSHHPTSQRPNRCTGGSIRRPPLTVSTARPSRYLADTTAYQPDFIPSTHPSCSAPCTLPCGGCAPSQNFPPLDASGRHGHRREIIRRRGYTCIASSSTLLANNAHRTCHQAPTGRTSSRAVYLPPMV